MEIASLIIISCILGTWWIGLYGYTSGSYNLLVRDSSKYKSTANAIIFIHTSVSYTFLSISLSPYLKPNARIIVLTMDHVEEWVVTAPVILEELLANWVSTFHVVIYISIYLPSIFHSRYQFSKYIISSFLLCRILHLVIISIPSDSRYARWSFRTRFCIR